MRRNHKSLKKWVKQTYGTQIEFAKFFGYTRETICYKLNGVLPFTVEDIQRLKDEHNLTPEQIVLFFFTKEKGGRNGK